MFKYIKFQDLEIGKKFFYSGTLYTKKSSRTAYINEYRFFYFGKNEIINPFNHELYNKLMRKGA